jgi:hypothetical protein
MIYLFNVMIYYCYASVICLLVNGDFYLNGGDFKNIGIFCLMPLFYRWRKISLFTAEDWNRCGIKTLKTFGKKYLVLSLVAVLLPIVVISMVEQQKTFFITKNQGQFIFFFFATSFHFCYHEIVKQS